MTKQGINMTILATKRQVVFNTVPEGEQWSQMLKGEGPGMVALLGISHAGYLVHKAIPHSQRG